mgnify:CR=1 FL=1
MNIVIAGGTGFVGQKLAATLASQRHKVYILTRSPDAHNDTDEVKHIEWLTEGSEPWKHLPHIDACINLAGDSLFGYWTATKKKRIRISRITATNHMLELIKKMEQKPNVFINASAIGYYGTSDYATYTEDDELPGYDFLAQVTSHWEQTARQAEVLGIRTVLTRFGVILGKDGALPMMALPFKWMVGGKVGSGKQWLSWIHIDDVIGLLIFSIHNQQINGALNVVSPQPVRNQLFSQKLAKVLHRPYWLPAPTFALRAFLGEMSILVVEGQHVLPTKAITNKYTFQFPTLDEALTNLYS